MVWNPAWGPVVAWVGLVSGVVLLALVGYMRQHFTPAKDAERYQQETNERFTKLEKSISTKLSELTKLVEKSQDRYEQQFVTLKEFNGLGSRVNEIKDRVTDCEGESRAAFNLAHGASNDVRHLTSRLEEVIGEAIKELKTEVKEMARIYRDMKGGGPNA